MVCKRVYEPDRSRVAGLVVILDLEEIVGSEMCDRTALAYDHPFDLVVCIFAAETHLRHRQGSNAARAFGAERAFAVKGIVDIGSHALFMKRYGHSASEMCDDDIEFIGLPAAFFGITPDHGPRVERMEDTLFREFRMPGHASQLRKFVHCHRVCDIGLAGIIAVLRISLPCYGIGKDGSEIAGMLTVNGIGKIGNHLVIDHVRAGAVRLYKSAPSHYGIEGLYAHACRLQRFHDSVVTEILLGTDVGI